MLSLTEWLLILISVLFGFYTWSNYNFTYWRRKNVPFIEPNPFFGNLKQMLSTSKSPGEKLQEIYNHKNGKDHPFIGIYCFNRPTLIIRQPELIKSILVKNFNKFSNRYASASDPLASSNLFFIKNPYWKELRSKLSPIFTSGNLKQMFPLVQQVGDELDKHLLSIDADKDGCFIGEVKELSALYTTDVIASVAFGVEANSLKNPEGEFRRNGRSIFTFNLWRALQYNIAFFLPALSKITRSRVFPKDVEKFIRKSIGYIMEQRIRSENIRKDLIDILIALKKESEVNDENNLLVMNNDVMVAQAGIFFVAGYETTSATMSFCLYELAKSPEIQKRLREEIRASLKETDDNIDYETVNKMKYLNMVILEILRLYPPVSFLDRVSTLSSDEKEFSLEPESHFAIPNNMGVYIPVLALHRDPEYFPNPEVFDPERFSAENKMNIRPYTYMPFGLGPHNCIGERFGLVQTKIGIINVLKNHYVTVCDRSYEKMILDEKSLTMQAKGGIYCKIVRDPLV